MKRTLALLLAGGFTLVLVVKLLLPASAAGNGGAISIVAIEQPDPVTFVATINTSSATDPYDGFRIHVKVVVVPALNVDEIQNIVEGSTILDGSGTSSVSCSNESAVPDEGIFVCNALNGQNTTDAGRLTTIVVKLLAPGNGCISLALDTYTIDKASGSAQSNTVDVSARKLGTGITGCLDTTPTAEPTPDCSQQTSPPTAACPTFTPTATPDCSQPTSPPNAACVTPTATPTPCTGDQDCDGVLDATDNCLSIANPLQENSDRNFIDQTPPSTQDDRTWPRSDATGDACDNDDDNDGILDVNEAAGCNASGPLSPTNRDTDGDRVLDGAECTLATNPASAASKPTAAACAAFLGVGASVDTDGDRIFDRVEYCAYNTDRLLLDTDGDQDASPLNANPAVNLIKDGCEAASLNNDRVVNSADQLLIALEITREIDQTLRLVSMDINKDGGVNSGDQLLMVGFITVLGSCP